MKQKSFQLLCAVMLGFGQLAMMVGYDSESFILESVIHSISERQPDTISPYAGYYGQAVIFAFYTITSFLAPSVLNVTTAKCMLIMSAVSYGLFSVGFLFINSYYFYVSGALLGAGTALFYIGQGSYLTAHSTRETIESNVSISWSVGCCCLLLGSVIMGGITHFSVEDHSEHIVTNLTVSAKDQERRFSDLEIRLMFSAFTGISILGILTYCFLPSRDVKNCIESSEKRGTFMEGLKLTCLTAVDPKMVQLIPLTMLGGFNVSFWLSIFPTAMNFTRHNAQMIYIPSVWSMGSGLGEVIMALIISTLSKRITGFGLKPTMVIGAISVTLYCFLVHISTPFEAPMTPTSQDPLLIYHSYHLIFLIAFLAGVSDCCINGVRAVICALVLPERRVQSYSVARMYHAAACTIVFFFSPITPLYIYMIGIPILSVFATIVFFRVANSTKTMERKLTQITMMEEEKKKELEEKRQVY